MKTYCVSCREKTLNKDAMPVKRGDRHMLKSKCTVCGNAKSRMLSEDQFKALKQPKNMSGGFIIPALLGLLGGTLIK